jgi:hypothetical protein
MSAVEPSTTSQSAASEPVRAGAIETGGAKKAYGDRNFKPMTLPSLGGSGPILPEWLRQLFRRKDTPAAR